MLAQENSWEKVENSKQERLERQIRVDYIGVALHIANSYTSSQQN